MDEQQLEIRGIAHFPASELAETTDRERAEWFILKVFAANRDTFVEHYFRQIRKGLREIGQSDSRVQKVLGVNQKKLIVLEPIKDLLPFIETAGGFDPRSQFSSQ